MRVQTIVLSVAVVTAAVSPLSADAQVTCPDGSRVNVPSYSAYKAATEEMAAVAGGPRTYTGPSESVYRASACLSAPVKPPTAAPAAARTGLKVGNDWDYFGGMLGGLLTMAAAADAAANDVRRNAALAREAEAALLEVRRVEEARREAEDRAKKEAEDLAFRKEVGSLKGQKAPGSLEPMGSASGDLQPKEAIRWDSGGPIFPPVAPEAARPDEPARAPVDQALEDRATIERAGGVHQLALAKLPPRMMSAIGLAARMSFEAPGAPIGIERIRLEAVAHLQAMPNLGDPETSRLLLPYFRDRAKFRTDVLVPLRKLSQEGR